MRFTALAMALFCSVGCSQHYEEGTNPPPRTPVGRLPADHPPAAGQKASEEAANISGTIRISQALQERVPRNAYLWIICRERADGGPPLVLQQSRVPRFPHRFTLTQKDVATMFGEGIVLAEIPEMFLVAKIDQDNRVGNQPGDMEGACSANPIAAGTPNADITIDRVQ